MVDWGQHSVHIGHSATMRIIAADSAKADDIAADVVKHMPSTTAGSLGRLPRDGWSSAMLGDMASPTKQTLEAFGIYGI